MAKYNTNEFKTGLKLLLDGVPCAILENEFVKPGKGQAFNRVRLRNLKTGRVVDRTFRSGESVEAAEVLDLELQYLYTDGSQCHFMHPQSFEQYMTPVSAIGEQNRWLKAETLCRVILWNGEPLMVELPKTVTLQVSRTEPGVRGDTATGATKMATLETGAEVRVPLFIEEGELIRIDIRSSEYQGREKE